MNPPKGPKPGLNVSPPPPHPGRVRDADVADQDPHIDAGLGGSGLKGGDFRINHDSEYVHDCIAMASSNARPATRPPVLSEIMVDAAAEARDFLRRALQETGLSPYALARKAGVAPTTITRPLNDPAFKFVPKQATLTKIAEAAGLTAPRLGEPSLSIEAVTQRVPLIGEVRAGAWTEVQDEPRVEELLPVHLPEYLGASLFAVRVAGRSMDLKYQEGTVVIAVPPAEAGVRVGDDVIVRRRQGALAETTLKEVARGPDGSYMLCPRSSDKSFQPIHIERGSAANQDGPEIIGVVIYSINPRRSGRGPLVVFGE